MRALLGSLDVWELVEERYKDPDSQEEEASMSDARRKQLKESKRKDKKSSLYYLSRCR